MKFESIPRKNRFIEKYDYGKGIVGFGEYVLRIASSCPLGCSYCYLQDVNKTSPPKTYCNFEQLKQEILDLRKSRSGNIFLNAGENADSLVFEPETGVVSTLDDLLSDVSDIHIELRTKTDNIAFLKNIRNKHKFTVVFTASPKNIFEKYEKKTATPEQRITAAKKCQEFGFSVGFRFEPIINSATVIDDYSGLTRMLSDCLYKDKIHSIGLSCLRFTKGLLKKMERTCPELLLDEIFSGPDGKFRYFRPIRTKIYLQIIKQINKYLPQVPVFLSSEPEYVWHDAGLKLALKQEY